MLTIVVSADDSLIAATNDRSILSVSTGSCCSCDSEEKPVPKSSRAINTPLLAQPPERVQPWACDLHECVLGDLEAELRGLARDLVKQFEQSIGEAWVSELYGWDIDVHSESGCAWRSELPLRDLRERLVENPSRQRHQEATLSRDREELRRAQHAAFRVAPADQRLDAHRFARDQVDNQLKREEQAAVGDPLAQCRLGRETLRRANRKGVDELLVAAAALRLRAIHRKVRMAQERLRLLVTFWHDDPKAGAHHDLAPLDGYGIAHRPEDPRRHLRHLLGVIDGLEHHDELVPAEPRDRVAVANDLAKPRGDMTKEGVARAVAEAVVDDLEAVEVEEEHGKLPLLSRSQG